MSREAFCSYLRMGRVAIRGPFCFLAKKLDASPGVLGGKQRVQHAVVQGVAGA